MDETAAVARLLPAICESEHVILLSDVARASEEKDMRGLLVIVKKVLATQGGSGIAGREKRRPATSLVNSCNAGAHCCACASTP